jgi:hypothetical protein
MVADLEPISVVLKWRRRESHDSASRSPAAPQACCSMIPLASAAASSIYERSNVRWKAYGFRAVPTWGIGGSDGSGQRWPTWSPGVNSKSRVPQGIPTATRRTRPAGRGVEGPGLEVSAELELTHRAATRPEVRMRTPLHAMRNFLSTASAAADSRPGVGDHHNHDKVSEGWKEAQAFRHTPASRGRGCRSLSQASGLVAQTVSC